VIAHFDLTAVGIQHCVMSQMCALIGAHYNLAACKHHGNKASYKYKLVDASQGIHEEKARPETSF